MRSTAWRYSSAVYARSRPMPALFSANASASQLSWNTGSSRSTSIGPKPFIPPRSWIPSMLSPSRARDARMQRPVAFAPQHFLHDRVDRPAFVGLLDAEEVEAMGVETLAIGAAALDQHRDLRNSVGAVEIELRVAAQVMRLQRAQRDLARFHEAVPGDRLGRRATQVGVVGVHGAGETSGERRPVFPVEAVREAGDQLLHAETIFDLGHAIRAPSDPQLREVDRAPVHGPEQQQDLVRKRV